MKSPSFFHPFLNEAPPIASIAFTQSLAPAEAEPEGPDGIGADFGAGFGGGFWTVAAAAAALAYCQMGIQHF